MIAHRDIVVIGASAGGVEAVSEIARGLPADLPAALFIVVHVGARSYPVLAQILSRIGALPAHYAAADEVIRFGRIYVAPPAHHLLLENGRIRLGQAAMEHGVRPAADALFRSAASAYGARVIGVVLSGSGGDGATGLQAIRAAGGVAIVQDPSDAKVPDMPRQALATGPVDHCVRRAEIAPLLARLCGRPSGTHDDVNRGPSARPAATSPLSLYELCRERIAENQRLLQLSNAQVEAVRARLEMLAQSRAKSATDAKRKSGL